MENSPDDDVATKAARWFGVVDMKDAPDTGVIVVGQLLDMLEHVRPSRLDRAASIVRTQGVGPGRQVEVDLVHATDAVARIVLVVGQDQATVSWLSAHEHIDREDGTPGRAWTSVVVDVAAAVIRGEYAVDEVRRGRLWAKTRIVDLASEPERLVSESGSLLWSWLPVGPKRVQRRRCDWGTGPR